MRVKTAHPTFNNTIGAIDMTKQNLTQGENIRAKRVEGSSPPDYTALAEQLRAVKHYESEDCWYSCPESEEGCCNDGRTGCDCHAPTMWAAADALEAQATRITELEREEMDQELDFQIPEIVKIPFYTVRNGMVLKVLTFQVLGPVADVIEDTGKLVKALEETES